jgi:hypothetical protein
LLLVSFAAVLGVRGVAHADAYFDAVASADGIDVTLKPGQQALGDTFEAGGLVAQAKLDALGVSTAFASHPYPGQLVVGQVGANYPFYVYSSYPDHVSGAQDLPVSTLSAKSDATSSQAAASGTPSLPGVAAGATSATSKVVQGADGSVSAVSDVQVQGFAVAGVLAIADIHGHAEAKRDSAGHVTRSATFSIGSASVGGVPVAISSDGLVIAGATVPLPLPTQSVNQALSAAGISIQEIAGATTEDSATAPAIAITFAGNVPNVGDVEAAYLLGYAHASLGLNGAADGSGFAPGPAPPTVPAATHSPKAMAPSSAEGTTGAPVAPAASDSSGGLVSGPGDTATPVAPVVASAVPAVGNGGTRLVAQARRPLRPYSWISLYVLAIAACGLAVGGGLLVRHLGVRAR